MDLVDAVRQAAATSGAAPAITHVSYAVAAGGRRAATTTLTYAELDERARAVAARLRRDRAPDARVAVLCPHEPAYLVAFLACCYAGLTAVPLYAPEPLRTDERLRAVLADCAPDVVLTTTAARRSVEAVLQALPGDAPAVLEVDAVGTAGAAGWRPPEPSDAPAYLQYTSGSTGSPSGVRISRANLTAALDQLKAHHRPATTVSWLPLFHDFGLVCGGLCALSCGGQAVLISPLAYVQDPARWLRAIADHRADWAFCPPSSLAHCVRRVTAEQKRGLDLSGLKLLTVAAEPVHAEVTGAFAAAFAECGLAAEVVTPAYGLAEATLPVTVTPLGQGVLAHPFDRAALGEDRVKPCSGKDPAAQPVVSCGPPNPGITVRIMDPAGARERAADEVGEIWVRGPNVADGYWRRPRRSAEVFVTRPDGTWLRTGDLGFLHQDHLYVTGRLKDLIIIRGRNHYPEDIEATVRAACAPAAPGSVAAFSVPAADGERLVVLVEGGPGLTDGVVPALRRAINRHHGLTAQDLLLVRRGTLPRTTSGKVRRRACRERYLRGGFRS
ncbi:fatty acyl-AMP ligase [Nonomuraea sp. NN258]|uniref:fatty acyl-AMP ligase n=1 Tax=Nonomuraea antri TaxID=2730852 RepID=UPI001567EFC9|nr:fatty acyl-AMP ligase [Nonomuraea antri]NRQ31675.1 fatty acyl-AMP ligase [Nonomuraea antri]